jgi:pimeloyl-ACP methyl ester carboxylesterase
MDFWAPFLAVSDVVLIDQRGVGDADLTWRWDGPPPRSFFVHADSARRHSEELDRRALVAIRARGVDLAGYTTAESATDLDELRAALGIEKVSLLAFSYGTHLACAYLRRYDGHVENVVMFGLEGPDQTYKLPWAMDTQFRKLAPARRRGPADRQAGPGPGGALRPRDREARAEADCDPGAGTLRQGHAAGARGPVRPALHHAHRHRATPPTWSCSRACSGASTRAIRPCSHGSCASVRPW